MNAIQRRVSSLPPSGTAPTAPRKSEKEIALQKLQETARSFEAIFFNMALGSMRKSVPSSGFLSGGRGEEVFTQMLDTTYSEQVTNRKGGLGLARIIVDRYMKHVQAMEGRNGNAVDLQP